MVQTTGQQRQEERQRKSGTKFEFGEQGCLTDAELTLANPWDIAAWINAAPMRHLAQLTHILDTLGIFAQFATIAPSQKDQDASSASP